MSITSVGSSFSYIRPETAARSAAAPAREETSETSAFRSSAFESDDAEPQASGSSRASVADELRSLLVKSQENDRTPPAPREAARAYSRG